MQISRTLNSSHSIVAQVQPKPVQQSFSEVINNLLTTWSRTEGAVDARIAHLPTGVSELFQLQKSMGTLQLQTECAAHAADSVGTTIRKMQQLGGQ